MSRKHNRANDFEPIDTEALAAEVNTMPPPRTYRRRETEAERDERIRREFDRRRIRNDARTDRRVAAAITDWDTCCIPGCGANLAVVPLSRIGARCEDVSQRLPLCARHQAIIVNWATPAWHTADLRDMRERLARQWVEREIKRERQADIAEENDGHEQGQIYFVRLNGMVKVGWSGKLRSRLKQYGASAEILCHYPATRDDETHLHRQLSPYRAKGREWYQDCKLIADIVAGVIERHGEPTIFPYWTEPKADLAARPKSWPAA